MLVDNRYVSIKFSRSRLMERNREISVLIDMSDFLAGSMHLKGLLKGAIAKVLDFFDLEAGRIYLTDDSGQFLRLAAYQGMEPHGLEKVHINEGFSGKAARTRSFIAQYVTDLEDKRRAAVLSGMGFKIVICVPLIAMDQVAGVMNLATGRIIALDQGKIDLLMAIGNQIAVAVNNAINHEALENKLKALKEKKETIKFFAYTVSHDLKSPATGIYGLARRLNEKSGHLLDQKGRECCEQIMKTAEHMVSLTDRVNGYIKAKEAPLKFEKIHVKEVTEAVRNEFSAVLKQRGIKWTEPDRLPEIVADKLALSSVYGNFVDNALKYGGEKMLEIRIGYEENDMSYVFSVGDDGAGIGTVDKERLFDIFHRDDSSRGTEGSGLGLAIVKEIAKGHRGRVWVDTAPGKGTTFYISISKYLNIPE